MTEQTFPSRPVLIVDDELPILKGFELVLRSGGITHFRKFQDGRDVIPFLEKESACLILLDVNMPHLSGIELLKQISRNYPDIPVIIITGYNEVELAVACMKNNAFDYMVKPVEKNRLISGVKRAIEIRRLADENQFLKERIFQDNLAKPHAFKRIMTQNKTMIRLFCYIESVAASPNPILITGETGTGKELIARSIHDVSRPRGPFVSVNVAGIDDTAFTDTLFGHLKGAFTGAAAHRAGLVDQAAHGTLFLDEIGDLKPETQVKLLRLIQENEYYMMGSDLPRKMEARIIVATNHDLLKEQKKGRFRKDLFFRLNSHHVQLPPLRERTGDLPLLVQAFITEAARAFKRKAPPFPAELITLLKNYSFPGNIRELKGMVFDAVGRHQSGKLTLHTFKRHIDFNPRHRTDAGIRAAKTSGFDGFDVLPTIETAQMLLMKEAMKRTDNNKTMAAEMLGISRQKLIRHLKKV